MYAQSAQWHSRVSTAFGTGNIFLGIRRFGFREVDEPNAADFRQILDRRIQGTHTHLIACICTIARIAIHDRRVFVGEGAIMGSIPENLSVYMTFERCIALSCNWRPVLFGIVYIFYRSCESDACAKIDRARLGPTSGTCKWTQT